RDITGIRLRLAHAGMIPVGSIANSLLGQLKPDHLHYATTEPYLGTDLLFAYTNTFVQGMGLIRAHQCLIEAVGLVVFDPDAEPAPGSARDVHDRWKASGRRVETIDLADLRRDVPASGPTRTLPDEPTQATLPRVIRAMLFADVAGFSQMREELAPTF